MARIQYSDGHTYDTQKNDSSRRDTLDSFLDGASRLFKKMKGPDRQQYNFCNRMRGLQNRLSRQLEDAYYYGQLYGDYSQFNDLQDDIDLIEELTGELMDAYSTEEFLQNCRREVTYLFEKYKED